MHASRARGEVRFELEKRIPMGGGLGGGSSNAAAVLLALPVLTGKPLPPSKLHDLAAELGSDVPFFLYGGTALGLGRGTELYPLADVPAARGLLVAPPSSRLDTRSPTARSAASQAAPGRQSITIRTNGPPVEKTISRMPFTPNIPN